jgi:TRAP-type uncharacterized transport system fused permease subunit
VPLLVLVYLLIRDYSPFYASAISVLALVLASALRAETRMSVTELLHALQLTTREALMLSATTAIAAVVVGVISLTGLMLKVTAAMVAVAGGSLLFGIAIVALISAVVGMGLPITSSYIIVSTLGAPALTELGLSLLAAHLIIFWFSQSATITPPVCMTAFVAAQIAGAPPMRTGFEALWLAKALYLVPLMTEGYYFGRLGIAGRGAVALASIAFFVSTFSRDIVSTVAWLVSGLAVLGALAVIQTRRSSRPSPISAGAPG